MAFDFPSVMPPATFVSKRKTGVPDITYETVSVKDMVLIKEENDDPKVKVNIVEVEVNGQTLGSSRRFLTSMCAIYGFAPSIFTYFDPHEVLDRIFARRTADQKVRLAVENCNGVGAIALGVSKPTKPLINKDMLSSILTKLGQKIEDAEYGNGTVITWHEPKLGSPFTVLGDEFSTQFIVETPIDGYGVPAAYLSLFRHPDNSDIIAYSKAFRSKVSLGTKSPDAVPTMSRFIESFSNEEGFAALRQRYESSAVTPVSLDEYFSLYNLLHQDEMRSMHLDESGNYVAPFASVVTDKLRKMCGSLEIYGIINFESLSQKKRRSIPTTGLMYNLLNFATELASHHATVEQARRLQHWVGGMITDQEFDLEGTLSDTEEPKDLFFGKKDEDEPDVE